MSVINLRKHIVILILFLTCSSTFSQNKKEKEYISNYEYGQFLDWVRESKVGINYNYSVNGKKINVYPNNSIWIDTAENIKNIDITSDGYIPQGLRENLEWNYSRHPYFKDYPVQGITKEQIDAFLHWTKHNKLKYSKNKPYKSDSIKVLVDAKFWEITNEEYRDFVNWTTDSIIRTALFDYDPNLSFTPSYDYEIDIDPFINWNAELMDHHLDSIKEKTDLMADSEKYKGPRGIDKRKIKYKYYTVDIVELIKIRQGLVESHDDFVSKVITPIYPDTLLFKENYDASKKEKFEKKEYSKDLIKGINYDMAKAYYYWYLREKIKFIKIDKKKNPLGFYVIPNEMEWKAAKADNNYEPFYKYIKIPEINYYP